MSSLGRSQILRSMYFLMLPYHCLRKLFYGGRREWWGLSKIVGHHAWSTKKKNLKLHQLGCPKTLKKTRNLDQKKMIQNLKFGIYLLTSDCHQKQAKKITHFTIQFRSKNLTHFTNLNSLNIIRNILMQHSQKPYLLKNICIAAFLDTQKLPSQSTWKANVCKCSSKNFCSRDVTSIYLVGAL